ncbi:MAG: GerAB/ArcD/ProY family transporter [Christensenellales bacterium]|jgi:spore germination protein KB
MNDKPVITSVQLALMSVGSALVFPYTFMPILNAPPANQDVWVVLLVTLVYIFILNFPILFLMNKFRGMTINEMSELVLGKFFGKVALIPVALFSIFCYIACMLITAVFITLYIFPDTPTWALLIFMVVPVSYAAYKGAGVVSRLSNFIVPIAILTAALFFIISISNMDFSILQPVLADSTFMEINLGAFLTAARYSEILIFWVFSYFMIRKSNVNKTYAAAQLIFLISFFLILIPTVTVLGIEYAKRTWNPYFTFTRQIVFFDFMERMQPFNLMAWFPCALLKLSIYSYMASYILSGIFKAKSHKHFVLPLSAVAFIACLLPIMNKSSTIEILRSDEVFPYIILPAILGIPVIMFIVYLMRRKKINLILSKRRKNAGDDQHKAARQP